MEKFAVDLDKVLDDFELNEDRAEQLAKAPPLVRPPPYRRPQFEPINMADADFSAAPPALPASSSSSSSEDDRDPPTYRIPRNVNETFYEWRPRDVKTVVNNLAANRNRKNEEKEGSNLAELPALLNNAIPRMTVVSSCETSEDEGDDVNNATVVENVVAKVDNVEARSETVESVPEVAVGEIVKTETEKTVEEKSVITFSAMDHLSDTELLSYLQEMEDEETPVHVEVKDAVIDVPETVESVACASTEEVVLNVVEPPSDGDLVTKEDSEVEMMVDNREIVDNAVERNVSLEVECDQQSASREEECVIEQLVEELQVREVVVEQERALEEVPEEAPRGRESPEHIPESREMEDSSPEDEESMDERPGCIAISAETGAPIQLLEDRERPGMAVNEVRTPMVQHPRDGADIHVLGEEERPTRPKYLLLANNSATMTGPPGETPHNTDQPALDDNSNAIVDDAESLDNAANANVLIDNENLARDTPLSPEPPARDPAPLLTPEERSLGKLPPFWIPDQDAPGCMLCDTRFTVIKRRHHCRACGKVLCSKCCGLKFHLEYMENAEGRVCQPCHETLEKVSRVQQGEGLSSPRLPPNPNNPMEYCSTVPPLEQAAQTSSQPPSVLVPVLKQRDAAPRAPHQVKQVMFSDGIRPGGDLTELDGSSETRSTLRTRQGRPARRVTTPPGSSPGMAIVKSPTAASAADCLLRGDGSLPPVATVLKGELRLTEAPSPSDLMAKLKEETVAFAVNKNLFVNVKIVELSCCVNRTCWCFSTQGLSSVGQDEVMLVLELSSEDSTLPADIFTLVNTLYMDALKGSTVSELGCTLLDGPFLGSNQNGAVMYIRPTFQCLQRLVLPSAPYLVAILVHRSEVAWARVFPLRLALRLGAELRYYPCCLVSVRDRKPVYREVKHTIMNLLADFRNMSYTLPSVRGLTVHMEERQTSVLVPKNRYDQVTRALNNSNEHVLALAANLSLDADSHLVCVQSETDDTYHTQAINIHNKPRKLTGASFIVFNGALKTSSNLTAKSSIVEDGLMVQITADTMQELRTALRAMRDYSIGCGPAGAATPDEVVLVKWVDDDKQFNIGVRSVIDSRCLDGVPSIRVHNGTDYLGHSRLVRWTEVFILQSDEGGSRPDEPVDIGRLSETIARATCTALVSLLDLLAQADYTRLAVRADISAENVGYEVGSRGEKLPPIYMNSLDNALVPVLHASASSNQNTACVLELVFHVLRQ